MNLHTVPEEFLKRLSDIVGQSLFYQIEKTFAERATTFRVNTLKLGKLGNLEIGKLLIDEGFKLKHVSWYADAFILFNRSKRELTETDVYKEGKIYIQSLASMVPPLVLDPKPEEKVLDLTAAPGSKTSQIAALMSAQGGSASGGEPKGELVANDSNKVRFFKLKHNMELLGVTSPRAPLLSSRGGSAFGGKERGVLDEPSPLGEGQGEGNQWTFTLRMEDGSHLCGDYPNYFDKILVDAPCSAEARFIADDPKTYGYWSEKKIKEMAYKQRKLLFSAWHALKPGGTLVYSTCTFAPEENEAVVDWALGKYPELVTLEPVTLPCENVSPGLTEWEDRVYHPSLHQTVRIMPNAVMEAFFLAKFRKQALLTYS